MISSIIGSGPLGLIPSSKKPPKAVSEYLVAFSSKKPPKNHLQNELQISVARIFQFNLNSTISMCVEPWFKNDFNWQQNWPSALDNFSSSLNSLLSKSEKLSH